MTQTKNLVAIGGTQTQDPVNDAGELTADTTAQSDETLPQEAADEAVWDDDQEWAEDEAEPRNTAWIMPSLAVLTIIGWTGFFGWAHQSQMLSPASPAQWINWITDWATPIILVLAVWFLAMRNSRREAGRFSDAASALSAESTQLEVRLVTVNRELSLAREFLAAQSFELESLGRVAAERLSTNADRLQTLIHDNGEQVRAIGDVSTNAVENMDNLRDQLPVLTNAARDLASQIGNAGNTARDNLDGMVERFDRLNQFGEAGSRLVDGLKTRITETLKGLEAQVSNLDAMAEQRFVGLAERSETFRVDMESKEVSALADMRRRGEELHGEFAERSEALAQVEAQALSNMREGLDTLRDDGLALASKLQDSHKEAATTWVSAIDELETRMEAAIARLSGLDRDAVDNTKARLVATMDEADRIQTETEEKIASFNDEVTRRHDEQSERNTQSMDQLEERLSGFDSRIVERQEDHLAHVAGLTERGEALGARLTELDEQIASLSQTGEETSQLLDGYTGGFAEKIGDSRALLEASSNAVTELTDQSVRLLEIIRSSKDFTTADLPEAITQAEERLSQFEHNASEIRKVMIEAEDKGSQLAAHIEQSRDGSAASLETLETLEARFGRLSDKSEELARQARGDLQSAIAALEGASEAMAETLRSSHEGILGEVSEQLGESSRAIIVDALRESSAEAIEEIRTTTERASEAGRETITELRDQLSRVNELAGNLEQRIAQSREKAEEQVDSDFSRSMALITDSLNSSAIDISKVFDNEVSDTSWASYLRGDRGIFTRRAVRLLDGNDAKSISDVYEEEPDFRETVNRYIHDFEAMLRHILSTRDGNAIAVTMLSSDIGKLYVALAQAIDRLRD